ncbi:uncharacterized protein LTHEOB_9939, partial [Lasiodiplodia theobromae]|uniref:uncharacterized protein n=1 Tax=Lasiodiplodia theobromae TaxID=45133 RepID=UPI0015C3A96B
MRLLHLQDDGNLSLVERLGDNIPSYAILSHTWGQDSDEVSFKDLMSGRGESKPGYCKVRFCADQAARDGLRYSWIDTCCIDKSSSAELSEAINSMFRWYQNADKCYVYLSDVSRGPSDGDEDGLQIWKPEFRGSRWFTRGWTLQELIAPASVEFFSREWINLGSKSSMEQTIHERTGVAIDALRGAPLSQFTMDERFMWAEGRTTKRDEDAVYCLLGIFDIQMPLLYGEGREKALKRLQKEIKESLGNRVQSLSDELKQTLLDSLRFDQIDARQMTIKNAHAKTCKWLLRKSEYRDWLNSAKLSEHHGFLWIKGKPGTGKSTLMKFAFANTRKTMKDTIVISFFFNARGEDIEKSTIGTYRSLLLQLLERLPALRCVFDSLSLSMPSNITDYFWTIESLKTLLEHAIKSLGECPVVCFIDALDECEEAQIRDMISFFERVGELTSSSGIYFQDIANYLETELKIGKSKLAQQIRGEMQEKASGVFMWAVLVVEILNKEHDGGRIHKLRKRLEEIPSELHELFRDILTRDSENRDELVLCIQWVLFAKQPLSPEQLYFAILSGVEADAVSIWDPEEITRDVIKRFILDSSKGLTEVTKSELQKVQFIHESTRQKEMVSHKRTFSKTFSYLVGLGLTIFFNNIRSKEAFKMFLKSLAVDQSPEMESYEADANDFDEEWSQKGPRRDFKFSRNRGLFPYLAKFGCKTAVSFLLKTGALEGNSKDSNGRTALLWAVENGYEAIVRLSLETERGYEAVVKLLLETGKVDVDSKTISLAVKRGYEAVVKLLLEVDKDGNVDGQGGKYDIPLYLASEKGYEKVVQMFLDKGANVNSEVEGSSSLCVASHFGREKV